MFKMESLARLLMAVPLEHCDGHYGPDFII
jgi:hypothetical protein